MSDLPPEQISPADLRALEMLQLLKQDAEHCGYQFAGPVISPSGTRYLVATDAPDNITDWIFDEENHGISSASIGRARVERRAPVALALQRIKQVLHAIQKNNHYQTANKESTRLRAFLCLG